MAQTVYVAYGGPDAAFARNLRDALASHGLVTFFFPDNATPGRRLHRVMRRGVQEYDRVILICSESSLSRFGVLNEIEETLQREAREGGTEVLIPIILDDFLLHNWAPSRADIAQAVRDRVVADFRGCKADPTAFAAAFSKLIAALGGSEPIVYVSFEGDLTINDRTGNSALLTIRRTFIPKRPDIVQLPARELLGSGKMRVVSVNFGTIAPISRGGVESFVTHFERPLPQDRPLTHQLSFEITDAFLARTEDFVFRDHSGYQSLELSIHLPTTRAALTGRAVREAGGTEFPASIFTITPCATHLRLKVAHPDRGSTYRVVWDW
jgi:hypothetical protein